MDRLEKDRRKKLERLRELGIDPYGSRVINPHHVDCSDRRKYLINPIKSTSANRNFNFSEVWSSDKSKCGQWAFICGRIRSKNNKGKLKFFFVEDETAKMQVMFSRSEFTEHEWEIIKCMEINDIISVGGLFMKTEAGEPTIFAGGWQVKELWNSELSELREERTGGVTLLCKSLAHPPEKFHGIADEEILIRKRHLGISHDKTLRDNLIRRSKIIASIRHFLNEEDFIEVETPILSSKASGATAKPFDTHHNALDMELKLRIAPELYLKKLLVGGIPKVYEIGKVFRNEGVDRTHNPEFTILELYQAYGNLEDMKIITRKIIELVMGKEVKWNTMTYQEACKVLGGIGIFSDNKEKVIDVAKTLPDDSSYQGDDYWEAVDHIFDKQVQPNLQDEFTFITDYPTALCPLAKPNSDGLTSGRFELFTQGMEIANAYTELNDPDVQLKMFEGQGTIDEEFIDALKLGMPPAGGLGIGIDRLVMLATNSQTIRDVITFPLVKDSQC